MFPHFKLFLLCILICVGFLCFSVYFLHQGSIYFIRNDVRQYFNVERSLPVGSMDHNLQLMRWNRLSSYHKSERDQGDQGDHGGLDHSPQYLFLHHQSLQPARKLPDALVIGVKKGGTRALLEFIRLHPDVRAAGSEVHFFDRHYLKGNHWYRKHMPPTLDGQITIEKTPSYFVVREVPKRVYEMNPDVKLIVVVRDPVTRAISDYTQVLSKNSSVPKFEDLAFRNGSQFGLVDTSWVPIRIGVYVRHLERWLHYFPLKQILFVSGERLIVDPATEIANVQAFLGIKQVITEKHFYFNATKGFHCLKKSEGHSNPHCLGKTKGRNHPPIDPTAIESLREFYRPFNARFYQICGINFGWP